MHLSYRNNMQKPLLLQLSLSKYNHNMNISSYFLATTWISWVMFQLFVLSLNISQHFPLTLAAFDDIPPRPCSHQDQAGVYQGEGPWASNPSTAVHHRGPVLRAQWARLPNLEEEVEEGGGRFWDTKVRPRGVVIMVDLPWLPRLRQKTCDVGHDTSIA